MRNYLLIIKMAFQSLISTKLRSFLTVLGIMIGVSSVVSIVSIGAGAESLITSAIQDIGTNLIGVLPGKSDDAGPPASAFGIVIKTLTYEDAKAIERLPHVEEVAAYANGNAEFVHGSRSYIANYSGVTPNYIVVENHEMDRGRFFDEREMRSSSRVAVLGMDIKDELFPLTDPIGENIRINDVSFNIIGLLERKGSSFASNPDNQVFVPLNTANNILRGEDYLGMIRLTVDDEANVPLVEKTVEKELRSRHKITNPDNDDFSVRSFVQALDTFTSIIGGIRFFLASVAAISLLVGGIGITNIMLMTVQERTREIGLRKALGARPSNIQNQFILEAIVLTMTGGIFGILFGILVSLTISVVAGYLGYNWDFVVPIQAMVLAFFVSAFIGIVFGTYPAKRAAKLNPINALRYE